MESILRNGESQLARQALILSEQDGRFRGETSPEAEPARDRGNVIELSGARARRHLGQDGCTPLEWCSCIHLSRQRPRWSDPFRPIPALQRDHRRRPRLAVRYAGVRTPSRSAASQKLSQLFGEALDAELGGPDIRGTMVVPADCTVGTAEELLPHAFSLPPSAAASSLYPPEILPVDAKVPPQRCHAGGSHRRGQ